jgi:hypothetical protein
MSCVLQTERGTKRQGRITQYPRRRGTEVDQGDWTSKLGSGVENRHKRHMAGTAIIGSLAKISDTGRVLVGEG